MSADNDEEPVTAGPPVCDLAACPCVKWCTEHGKCWRTTTVTPGASPPPEPSADVLTDTAGAEPQGDRSEPPEGVMTCGCEESGWYWHLEPEDGYDSEAECIAAAWAHHDTIHDRGRALGVAEERAAVLAALRGGVSGRVDDDVLRLAAHGLASHIERGDHHPEHADALHDMLAAAREEGRSLGVAEERAAVLDRLERAPETAASFAIGRALHAEMRAIAKGKHRDGPYGTDVIAPLLAAARAEERERADRRVAELKGDYEAHIGDLGKERAEREREEGRIAELEAERDAARASARAAHEKIERMRVVEAEVVTSLTRAASEQRDRADIAEAELAAAEERGRDNSFAGERMTVLAWMKQTNALREPDETYDAIERLICSIEAGWHWTSPLRIVPQEDPVARRDAATRAEAAEQWKKVVRACGGEQRRLLALLERCVNVLRPCQDSDDHAPCGIRDLLADIAAARNADRDP